MPDAYGLLDDFNRYNGKDKLVTLFLTIGIVIILQRVQKVFIKKYLNWLKKKGYRQNENEARQLYYIKQAPKVFDW